MTTDVVARAVQGVYERRLQRCPSEHGSPPAKQSGATRHSPFHARVALCETFKQLESLQVRVLSPLRAQ